MENSLIIGNIMKTGRKIMLLIIINTTKKIVNKIEERSAFFIKIFVILKESRFFLKNSCNKLTL